MFLGGVWNISRIIAWDISKRLPDLARRTVDLNKLKSLISPLHALIKDAISIVKELSEIFNRSAAVDNSMLCGIFLGANKVTSVSSCSEVFYEITEQSESLCSKDVDDIESLLQNTKWS